VRTDVVKEKMGHGLSGVVEGRHGFCPLGEVIDYHDDVFVSIVGLRVSSNQVYAPFVEGASRDDWVYKRRRCLCFIGEKLTFVTSLHNVDTFIKQGRPKVTSANDFLGDGHP
jgi:hypothetical protein